MTCVQDERKVGAVVVVRKSDLKLVKPESANRILGLIILLSDLNRRTFDGLRELDGSIFSMITWNV